MLTWKGPLVNLAGVTLALISGLILARLPLFQLLIAFALAIVLIGTILEPMVGLLVGLLLGLMRAYIQAEIPQIPAQIGHLFVGLAALSWLAQGLVRRDIRIARTPLLLPLLGFVGAAWLSLWNAADLAGYGLPELVKWIEIVVVFVITANRAKPKHLPWLVAGLLLVGLFQAGVGLYQFLLLEDGPEHFMIPGTEFYRAYGTFEQPNPYAGYIGLTLSLAAGAMLSAVQSRLAKKEPQSGVQQAQLRLVVFLLVCSVILAAALGASWSRGAWLGFASAVAVMAIALPKKPARGLLLAALLAGTALALYTANLIPQSIITRLTDFATGLRLEDVRGVGINDANYAVLERLAHWQAALEMWRYRFWTGVGIGCYEAAYPGFALINWPIALGHAHNLYLNMLAETGLIGLTSFLFLWGAVFWRTWQAAHGEHNLKRYTALGMLGVWTHLAVHNLFDNLYVNNVHLLIGLLLGILSATILHSEEMTRQPSGSSLSWPKRVT